MYEVIRTIRGNDYRYRQESYRENGRVKTRYEYLGPVNPKRKKGVLSALLGKVDDLARTHKPWEETEEQMLDRVAKKAAEYHLNDWLREKLDGRSGVGPTLAELALIAKYQHGELVLKETSHRHWELMPPSTEERTVHAPALVETRPEDNPAHAAIQEAEERQRDFMLGESEPAPDASPASCATPSEQPASDAPSEGSDGPGPQA